MPRPGSSLRRRATWLPGGKKLFVVIVKRLRARIRIFSQGLKVAWEKYVDQSLVDIWSNQMRRNGHHEWPNPLSELISCSSGHHEWPNPLSKLISLSLNKNRRRALQNIIWGDAIWGQVAAADLCSRPVLCQEMPCPPSPTTTCPRTCPPTCLELL